MVQSMSYTSLSCKQLYAHRPRSMILWGVISAKIQVNNFVSVPELI